MLLFHYHPIQEPAQIASCPHMWENQVFVLLYFMLFSFFFNNLHFVHNNSLMSIVIKWPIIGMNNAGMSCKEIGHQLGQNHTVFC